MLEVFEILIILRYQFAQKPKHVAFDIGVGILVYRQSARRVLRELLDPETSVRENAR